ncbi:sensor histidine kinase [Fulvivirga sp. M361]|uniref:sensor histidine kinase n=1 Tax=Fulvivirga sp. M361 TaxID=2594266 RepID=UPI00162A2D24|nr:histidine kinase [Fulvivirga sp. M361]
MTWVLHKIIFELVIPVIPWKYYIVSFTDAWILIVIFSSYLLVTTLFKLSKSWFRLQQLEKEKTDTELSHLRFQINPHFLLNTLNSLYGLSLRESKEIPTYIIRLGNILKHALYETQKDIIPLSTEILYIRDYISLHQIRLSEEADIAFIITGEVDNTHLSPFILIPFVENAFKHGFGVENGKGYAHFDLKVADGNLQFIAKNSIGHNDEVKNKQYKGIGLENVKRRLTLLYANRHDLRISSDSKEFSVQLELKLL